MVEDEDIAPVLAEDQPRPMPPPPPRQKRPRPPRQAGAWRVFIVFAAPDGLWRDIVSASSSEMVPEIADGAALVVGLVVAGWEWRQVGEHIDDQECRTFLKHLVERTKARTAQGVLDYPVLAAAELASYVAAPDSSAASVLSAIGSVEVIVRRHAGGVPVVARVPMGALVEPWRKEFVAPPTASSPCALPWLGALLPLRCTSSTWHW